MRQDGGREPKGEQRRYLKSGRRSPEFEVWLTGSDVAYLGPPVSVASGSGSEHLRDGDEKPPRSMPNRTGANGLPIPTRLQSKSGGVSGPATEARTRERPRFRRIARRSVSSGRPRKTWNCRIPSGRGSGAVISGAKDVALDGGKQRWLCFASSWSDGSGTAPVSKTRGCQDYDVGGVARSQRTSYRPRQSAMASSDAHLDWFGERGSPPATLNAQMKMKAEITSHAPSPNHPRATPSPEPPTANRVLAQGRLKRFAPGDQTCPLSECHRSRGQGG